MSKEVELGRIAGPFVMSPFANLQVFLLGVVPKKEPDQFCLIHYLLYWKGESVNDGISKEEVSVSYVSFDRAVDLVCVAGSRELLAKSDIDSAFRLLPVHPDCFHLLGYMIDGLYFYDMCLPMGCSITRCLVVSWNGLCVMKSVHQLSFITLMISCLWARRVWPQ